jgi:hypothetical protein
MPVPGVLIVEKNGALGGFNPSGDGIAGLILSHDAVAELPQNTPEAIHSVKDAETLGVTGFALAEIGDFFETAGEGQELWIMTVSKATLIEDICDKTNDIAKKMLVRAGGRIKIWGVSKEVEAAYVPDLTEGIDKDVLNSISKAHELCADLAQKYMPSRCLLPGRNYDGDNTKLKDLKAGTYNRAGITLLGKKGSKEAKVGYVLGLMSTNAVQRKIARVANGPLPGLNEAYLTDGTTKAEDLFVTQDAIHDKGYIFPVVRPGRAGYYLNDDPTATSNTDDFATFSNGRVQDKVERIAYDVYLDFVNDDYQVDASGKIGSAELKRLQGGVEDRVNAEMTAAGEISSFRCIVDAAQDVLTTGQTKVQLRTQPRAYHKEIVVEVGFTKTQE